MISVTSPAAAWRAHGFPAWRAAVLGGLLLCLAALPAFAQTGLATSSWPMFHHDLQHTGLSPYTGPATPTQK